MYLEVAEKLGISRKSYTSLENGKIIHYEKQIVDKLAELYQISVKELLDEIKISKKVWERRFKEILK